jgi:hypothetical protein
MNAKEPNLLKLKPTFLKENGQDKFAVFSIEEHAAIREALEESIRRDNGVRIPFAEVKREHAAHHKAIAKCRRTALKGRTKRKA